jgi:hypothetical protein
MVALANTPHTPQGVREFYDSLPEMPGLHVEIINGRVVVSPAGTPDHGRKLTRMSWVFQPLANEIGWDVWTGTVDVVIVGSRQPVIPDLVLASPGAPLWGARELRSDGLIMVGEVVSEASVDDDRKYKPGMYAGGGVPLMLLVDPIADPGIVTIFSHPKDGAYAHSAVVRIGEPLHIPEPVDFTLDTAIFLDD